MIYNNLYLIFGWIEVWYWYCYINILKYDINVLLWFYFVSVFYLNKYYRIYKKKKDIKNKCWIYMLKLKSIYFVEIYFVLYML